MRQSSHRKRQFNEEELEELIEIIRIKWQNDDPVILQFVFQVCELKKKNKMVDVIQCFQELIIRLIAEYLKRITSP